MVDPLGVDGFEIRECFCQSTDCLAFRFVGGVVEDYLTGYSDCFGIESAAEADFFGLRGR
jgi:hypothetical protein